MDEASYDERYSKPGWYWGTKPTGLAREVLRVVRSLPRRYRELIDLGAGEGRDSIFFARNGFRVEGVDISRVGIAKAARRAARLGLRVRFRVGDVRTYRLKRPVDVVFCSGALNNLPRRIRDSRLAHFKANTVPGGIHAMNAFVPKPYLAPPPEMDPAESLFRSGELLGYYWDWKILDSGQLEFDCSSSDVPHRHAMDVVIGQKPDQVDPIRRRIEGPNLALSSPPRIARLRTREPRGMDTGGSANERVWTRGWETLPFPELGCALIAVGHRSRGPFMKVAWSRPLTRPS